MNFDLEALVQETFNISSKELATEKERNSLFNFSDSKVFVVPEETAGLFYSVIKTSTTYIIKAIVSENLYLDYKDILNHPENYPSLKLDLEKDIESELQYFECDNINFANEIKKQICNKRFPLAEEKLFNVSDYSDHWWIDFTSTKIELSFKLRSGKNESLKIEALDDVRALKQDMQELFSYLNLIFPVNEFSIGDSKLVISSKVENELFKSFKEIFISGDTGVGFWNYLRDLELRSSDQAYLKKIQRANFILLRLASIRRFCLEVSTKL